MRKSILLAVLLVAVVAMPAFASVQNVKVSGGINSMFIHRNNFDLGDANTGAGGDEMQDVFATITKLRVDANLTDNVDAVISLINERTWNVPAADDNGDDGNTEININEAYVVLREMIYSPLTVKIGRQYLSYGNAFIMGGGNGAASSGFATVASDLTAQYGLDAIRATLDYNPLTIDMFYAKFDANNTGLVANDRDDVDYYGINATYNVGDDMNSVVEGYFFARYDKSTGADVINGGGEDGTQNDTVYCPGFRVTSNPLEGLNVQFEYAHQSGTVGDATDASNQQKRNANALQLMSSYMIPALTEYNPILSYSYTRYSGDGDITAVDGSGGLSGETYTAWDPMLNDQGAGTIACAILTKTQSQYHTVSLQVNPMEDVTSKFQYIGIWLTDATHTGDVGALNGLFNQPDGNATTLTGNVDESHVGNEFDWVTTWNYTEDVTLGANLAVFVPGKVFSGDNDDAATQAIFNVDVAF